MAIYLKITGAGNDESALGDCGNRYCLDGAFRWATFFSFFHSIPICMWLRSATTLFNKGQYNDPIGSSNRMACYF